MKAKPNGPVSDPDALLFTDRSGERAQLQDVIDDGQDGGYEDRIPPLIELQDSGDPYHRLLATVMLTSWGEPAGFKALIRWASQPEQAPWASAPVTLDRISGTDSAFEMLADALRASFYSKNAAALKPLQAEAAKALLRASPSHYVGRTLMVAITSDGALTAAVDSDLRRAIDASIDALRNDRRPGFDLATQTAGLLTPLARLDDAAAARSAQALIQVAPDNLRMLRELAGALANGSGADTLGVLQELKRMDQPAVTQDVQRALSRRAS